MATTLVVGGEIASMSHTGRFDILIEDDRIAEVLPFGQRAGSDHTIDAHGLSVFPGLVDAHVHFRDPGDPHRETFITGSSAAAAGGVTTVLEMPTSDPTVTDAGIFEARRDWLRDRSIVDFGLYGGAGIYNLGEISEQAAAGAVAFKTFLHSAPPGRDDSIGRICAPGDADLLQVISEVARTGLVHALHCEDDQLLKYFARTPSRERSFGERHARSRPMLAEDIAVARASVMGHGNAKLHFVHLSSALAIDLVSDMRARGLDATVETCPHYLALNDDILMAYGPHAKCNPPLRPEEARAELIERLSAGLIDIVASDHCPHTSDELEEATVDPIGAPAGLPGIEFMLPTLLSMAHSGAISHRDIALMTAFAPAQRFSLASKGDIAAGFSADLVLVDSQARWSPGDHKHFSMGTGAGRYLEGMSFVGRVDKTILRGELIYNEREVVREPGYGQWIPGCALIDRGQGSSIPVEQ